MSNALITVEQAAGQLNLHPKTVLRYIRNGQLPATRVGKSYRIARTKLDAFTGIASNATEIAAEVRATCVVDIPKASADEAERTATLLQSAAISGSANRQPSLHLQTTFDPLAKSMKVVLIGSPSDVAKLLEILQLQMSART